MDKTDPDKGLFLNLYINENGNECVTGFAADNMFPFLSAIGYFTKQPSEFEIKALEAGELLCFSRDHIVPNTFARLMTTAMCLGDRPTR